MRTCVDDTYRTVDDHGMGDSLPEGVDGTANAQGSTVDTVRRSARDGQTVGNSPPVRRGGVRF